MKTSNKTILIVIAIVVVFIVGIAFFYYRKGKKQVTIQKPPLDNPNSDSPENNPFAVSDAQITSIVDALHRDMDGLNWNGHDVQPYQDLNALSDSDFSRVYNVFNSKYQSDSGETLKQWIESESYVFDDVTDSIKQRMGRLNLL